METTEMIRGASGDYRGRRSSKLAVVPAVLLAALLLIPAGQVGGADAGVDANTKILGIQVHSSNSPTWKEGGATKYQFSPVPEVYQSKFEGVCVYVPWYEFEIGEGLYNIDKYKQIFEDIKAAGIKHVKVCFCHFLPGHVRNAIHRRFEKGERTYTGDYAEAWEPWVASWANRDPDNASGLTSMHDFTNWWSTQLFTGTGSDFKQMRTAGDAFYGFAVNLAIPEYKAMVREFARNFRQYVDVWEPWDEPGWGLNTCASGVNIYSDSGSINWPRKGSNLSITRFSGWPTQMTIKDSWGERIVPSDYEKVHLACYEALETAYSGSGKEPYLLTSSLVGGNSLLDKPYTEFNGNLVGYNCNDTTPYTTLAERDVSVVVRSDREVISERPVYFNYNGWCPGGHVTAGTTSPSKDWYFAEGNTLSNFDEYITVYNPSSTKASLALDYMIEGIGLVQRAETVNAYSRATFRAKEHLKDNAAYLGGNVSLHLRSSTPVLAERPMYFDYYGITGGDCAVGAKTISSTSFFAEGTTMPGFDEWLCLQNPNAEDMVINATYMMENRDPVYQEYLVPQHQRYTIKVNDVVGPYANVSVALSSDKGFVAERPMYFRAFRPDVTYSGGHDIVGAPSPKKTWHFAEGTTRKNEVDGFFEEWLCLQNPNPEEVTVNATYMLAGKEPIFASYQVPPSQRLTIEVSNPEFIEQGNDVSVLLSCESPFVAERPMYFNVSGKTPPNVFNGGSVSMGGEPSTKTYFAEGRVSPVFDEWITIVNPNDEEAKVHIDTYYSTIKGKTAHVKIPPKQRYTLLLNKLPPGAYAWTDAVSLHLFDMPSLWPGIYQGLKDELHKRFIDKELAVSSCGWGHGKSVMSVEDENYYYNPVEEGAEAEYPHSRDGQARAVRDWIRALFDQGCNKVWFFQDIDPRKTEDRFFGLFMYTTHAPLTESAIEPTDAWWEYVKLQEWLKSSGGSE
ncbi:MAG: hypothetical protein V1748_06960 [Actinomycetota bacterium]